MSSRFSGKVALISGGASGIGAETAKKIISEGGRAVIADLNADLGKRLAGILGSAALFVPLDVRDEAGWNAAVSAGEKAFGKIHIVVNAAGISIPASIEDATFAHWRDVMAINADGVFLGCKYGVEAIKRAGGGAIVNVASTLAVKAGPTFTAYSASKAAVRMLTKAVALHCAEKKYGIRVNTVMPGAIDTPMYQSYLDMGVKAGGKREEVAAGFAAVHPLGRVGEPAEVANAILFLASDDASYITGAEIPVDGGYLA